MSDENEKRISRLRSWLLVLVVVIVFTAIAAPTLVLVYVGSTASRIQLEVTCSILQAEIHQLEAIHRNGVLLEEITRSLGLPIVPPPQVEIPEVPPECEELP